MVMSRNFVSFVVFPPFPKVLVVIFTPSSDRSAYFCRAFIRQFFSPFLSHTPAQNLLVFTVLETLTCVPTLFTPENCCLSFYYVL